MKTKYQVFISSTYEDLKHERDIVIKAVLELGHIPVGMEMFSAGDEEQWELIKRQIDDSDYYIVIIAHRYGSKSGGLSYTEKEYDYAIENKIPALGFVIDQTANWPVALIDDDATSRLALTDFKTKVKSRIINFWKNAEDLHAKVSIALSKAVTAYPRPGWVRAAVSVGPEVTNELSRLSKENAELRIVAHTEQEKAFLEDEERKNIASISRLLAKNKVTIYLWYREATDWKRSKKVSLEEIFRHIAPQLAVEVDLLSLTQLLSVIYRHRNKANTDIRPEWPIPHNLIKNWLAYFKALGLMEPSIRIHAQDDTKEYWSITSLGQAVHSAMLVNQLEIGIGSNIPRIEGSAE